jgi:hypothetical protein
VTLLAPARVVSFKGPLLTRKLYGELGRRTSSDIDILVSSEDAPTALERLLADGYRGLPYGDPRTALSTKGSVNLYRSPESRTPSVDLHVHAFNPTLFEVSPQTIDEHLEQVSVHGTDVLTFDAPLSFVHMVAHFVTHRFERVILRDIGAAWDAWQRELDVDALSQLAKRTCTLEALEYALQASHTLGFAKREPLPVTTFRARLVQKRFAPRRIAEHESEGYINGFWSTFLVRPSAIPELALRGVYMSPEELSLRYQEPPSWRLFVRRATGPLRELRDRIQNRVR